MDVSANRPPRRIADTVAMNCRHCGRECYAETLIAETLPDGSTAHRREVRGAFSQITDASGHPAGPVIPMCFCQEKSHAQGG